MSYNSLSKNHTTALPQLEERSHTSQDGYSPMDCLVTWRSASQEESSSLHAWLMLPTLQQTSQGISGHKLCRLKPVLCVVFRNKRRTKTETDLMCCYQPFHTLSVALDMLISIFLDSLMLTQSKSHYIHLSYLQIRLKVISAGRLELLQRPFLVWRSKAFRAEDKNTETKAKCYLHLLQVTLKSKAKHNRIPAIHSLSPAAQLVHSVTPACGVRRLQAQDNIPDLLSTLGALCFFIAIKGTLK